MDGETWAFIGIVSFILILVIGVIMMLGSEIKEDEALCDKICSMKGCESLGFESDGWNRDEKCKCLTVEGDIEYYPAM